MTILKLKPMRLDVDTDSPALTARCTITLDGVPQHRCTIADEAEGYVVRFVASKDGFGSLKMRDGELVKETVYGKVEISFE